MRTHRRRDRAALCDRHQARLVEARKPGQRRRHGATSPRRSRDNDPYCRGVVLLGLEAPEEQLAAAFAIARGCDLVKGFAVGRTIFAEPARDWFAGRDRRREAVERMAGSFARLCKMWQDARAFGETRMIREGELQAAVEAGILDTATRDRLAAFLRDRRLPVDGAPWPTAEIRRHPCALVHRRLIVIGAWGFSRPPPSAPSAATP